jgi:hypothetical protein
VTVSSLKWSFKGVLNMAKEKEKLQIRPGMSQLIDLYQKELLQCMSWQIPKCFTTSN